MLLEKIKIKYCKKYLKNKDTTLKDNSKKMIVSKSRKC